MWPGITLALGKLHHTVLLQYVNRLHGVAAVQQQRRPGHRRLVVERLSRRRIQ
jgi:hypothetical protein